MSGIEQQRELARGLVAALDAEVLKRWNPRRELLVPALVSGRVPVASAKAGERVIDFCDPLIDAACEAWPEAAARLDVYLDLLSSGKSWFVEWVVEDAIQNPEEASGDAEAGET